MRDFTAVEVATAESERPVQIDKTYAYHKPSEAGLQVVGAIRGNFTKLHHDILALVPASRERAVALTQLETAAMWAIKAVVFNDPNSEVA